MEELNEMCDLSFESQPMQPEKECYSACIVYVEKSLKGMNLEELKKGDKLFNSSESLSDPCLNRPLVIRESLVVGAYAETAVLLLKAIMHAPNNAIRDGWLLPALFFYNSADFGVTLAGTVFLPVFPWCFRGQHHNQGQSGANPHCLCGRQHHLRPRHHQLAQQHLPRRTG